MNADDTTNLKMLMIERNQIIYLLDLLISRTVVEDINLIEHLEQQYRMKLLKIQHQLDEEARGMSCMICQSSIDPNQQVLACPVCGIPIHYDHKDSFLIAKTCVACKTHLYLETVDDFDTIKANFQLKMQNQLYWDRHLIFNLGNVKVATKRKKISQKVSCPKCGRLANLKWKFCKWCGAVLS